MSIFEGKVHFAHFARFAFLVSVRLEASSFHRVRQHFYFRYWEDLPHRKDRGKRNRMPEGAEDSRWRRGSEAGDVACVSAAAPGREGRGKLSGSRASRASRAPPPRPVVRELVTRHRGLCPAPRPAWPSSSQTDREARGTGLGVGGGRPLCPPVPPVPPKPLPLL